MICIYCLSDNKIDIILMEAQSKKELKSYFTADKLRYTFYFDLHPEQQPEKVEVYLEARTLTEDALLVAIGELNQRLRKDYMELVKDVALYKARLVGRNFKPKTDMPCLSLYQKICDLKIEEIAVQLPNRSKAILQLPKPIAQSQEKQVEQLTVKTEALTISTQQPKPFATEQAPPSEP